MKKAACASFIAATFSVSLIGEELEEKEIGLFYYPFSVETFHQPAGSGPADPFADPDPPDKPVRIGGFPDMHFKVVKSPLKKVLPGALHDARHFFDGFDTPFVDSDIAWHHPETGLVIVRASPETMEYIEEILSSVRYCGRDLIFQSSGRFVERTQEKEGAKEIILGAFRIPCQSGTEAEISKEGKGPANYEIKLTNSMGSDNITVSFCLEMKGTIHGNQFRLKTNGLTIIRSTRNFFLQGSSESSESIRFELTIFDQFIDRFPPLLSRREMRKLREEITKILHHYP